jgi:sterol 3beta-glucosyltransferase
MRVIVTNQGSVGDVQPLFALGAELAAAGHHPVFALAPFYRARVAELGFELAPVGPDLDLREIDRRDVSALLAGADPLQVLGRALGLLEAMLPRTFEELRQACRGADVLVAGPLQPAARMLHELTQIPFVSIQVNHFGGRREQAERDAIGAVVNGFRARHRLPPLADPVASDANSPQLALYAISRHLGLATTGWPGHQHMTGFFFLDEPDWEPPPELEEFLAAGEPPVVVSFSSLTCADPAALTELLLGAVRRAGCRAIVQHGWSGIARQESLPRRPREVLPLGFAPHAWLLPRAAAVVHHGGAQTTAAVLRAGVPAVVVPAVRDQPVWAELCWQLGVAGPPLPHSRLSAESLAAALAGAVGDAGMRAAAAALGEKVRAEPGVRRARRLVEELVDRVGLPGRAAAAAPRSGDDGRAIAPIAPIAPIAAIAAAPRPAAGAAAGETGGGATLADAAAGRPLQVLLLSIEYGPSLSGGVGTQVRELATGLAAAGHAVRVVACTAGAGRVERQGRLAVHLLSIAGGHGPRAPRSAVAGLLEWNDEIHALAAEAVERDGFSPDLVQCANWITFPAAERLARRLGCPLVAAVHYASEVESWWGQQPDPEIAAQERRLCDGADLLIAVSHALRELLMTAHGVAGERLRVVHNGLDPDRFAARPLAADRLAEMRRSLLGTDERLVLFAGRLNPMKGVPALIAAAARVAERRGGVRFLLAGEADSRDYGEHVRRLAAAEAGLGKSLTLLGKVPRQQLALLYQLADVAVVPSVYDFFPYAVLEAMAAGVPVVASRVGGLPETVEDGVTGLLIPVRRVHSESELRSADPEALAAALLGLLDDPETARRLGAAGRQRLLSELTTRRMIAATVDAYREAIARHGAMPPRPADRWAAAIPPRPPREPRLAAGVRAWP